MHIVSLLPSATEIGDVLGLGDSLVGVTRECDYPPAARAKLVGAASVCDGRTDSVTSDRVVAASMPDQRGSTAPDERLLRDQAPDLTLTREVRAAPCLGRTS